MHPSKNPGIAVDVPSPQPPPPGGSRGAEPGQKGYPVLHGESYALLVNLAYIYIYIIYKAGVTGFVILFSEVRNLHDKKIKNNKTSWRM